jgi:uncharacterized protein
VDPATAIGVSAVGLAAGVLSGMFGVGGAVVSTPGIRVLGASPIHAVGSTIPAILPGAISGAARYWRAGLVDARVGVVCGLTGALFAVGGSGVASAVDARWLMVLTAVLLAWSGASAIAKARSAGIAALEPEVVLADGEQPSGPAPEGVGLGALAGVGALAGFVAGLLGVGGGVIMMPLFTTVLRIPVKTAVGTSLVAVAIFSVPAMISHTLLGHIDWAIALLLVAGTVPGARIGSKITVGQAEDRVQLMLGIFFVVVSLLYGGGELVGILTD